jgi:RNA polymerase sigma-70 factor (ECF subfamily)
MGIQQSAEAREDRPMFNTLLEKHGRELYAYLWRILQNPQDAEDCLQDTYLRAFQAYARTTPEWNYRAWLYKIATNVARTHLKKKHRQVENELMDRAQVEFDPLDGIDRQEQVVRVMREVRRLSFRQRTALMMRKYSDLDYFEIAEALNCTPETARANVYQGLKRLRERLNPDGAKGVVDA